MEDGRYQRVDLSFVGGAWMRGQAVDVVLDLVAGVDEDGALVEELMVVRWMRGQLASLMDSFGEEQDGGAGELGGVGCRAQENRERKGRGFIGSDVVTNCSLMVVG